MRGGAGGWQTHRRRAVSGVKPPPKSLLGRLMGGRRPATPEVGRRHVAGGAKKKVWRISERAPAGEWVDPDEVVPAPPADRPAADTSSGGWLTSSMDLLNGTEIIEDEDTAPAPLPEERTLPLGTRLNRK